LMRDKTLRGRIHVQGAQGRVANVAAAWSTNALSFGFGLATRSSKTRRSVRALQ
jgi:hypothetical protein